MRAVRDIRSFALFSIAVALILHLVGRFVRNIEFSGAVSVFGHIPLSLELLRRLRVVVLLVGSVGVGMRLLLLSKLEILQGIVHHESDKNTINLQNFNVT